MIEPRKNSVRYMDFVSGGRSASSYPLLSRPAKRPVPKKPAPKPISSTSPKLPSHALAPKKEPKILYSKQPVLSEQSTKAKLERASAPKPVPKSVKITDKPADDLARKACVALSSSKKSLDAPDNNLYSLSGKSPFLANYSVDKRPLSSSVPEKKKSEDFEKLSFLGVSDSEEKPKRRNVYEKPKKSSEKKKKDSSAPVTIIDNSEKKSGIPLVVIIILTIIFGAAVGAGIYFILPN